MYSTRKTVLIFLFLVCFLKLNVLAQYYNTGQDPHSAKWSQINTNNFQIIFQREFEDKAQDIANILEYNYKLAGKSLDHHPKKISVIVHNQSVLSNGYVAWAPKRIDLSVTPPQDASPDIWLEHLCIHELRHVVQIDKLNQGITKILSVVFGQQATGLVAGQLPMWYYEGDAVCTETSLLKNGRGRMPYFQRELRTNLLSDEIRYTFDQSLFGSYKRHVPNHYEFGYQLTAFARQKYGTDIWGNVQNHVAKNSYTLLPTPFAFYRGLKKYAGLSQKELYHNMMDYLDSSWTTETIDIDYNLPKYFQNYIINDYEDYIHPIYIDKENILALKKGMSHIPQFVLVQKDGERVIHEPGYLISNDFSYTNNILVWAEYKPDYRWQNREYGDIKLYNIKLKKEFRLTSKLKLFSPDISKNADKIIAVKSDNQNNSSIVILNAFNGKLLQEIKPINSNTVLQRPKWSDDENSIYSIEITEDGKQVSKYSLIKNEWQVVFKHEKGDIQRILPYEDKVFFHSTINGVDNIYLFDELTKSIYQISDSKFGVAEFDITADKNQLIVNEYTSKGFRLATIPVERALWRKLETIEPYQFHLAETLTTQESNSDIPKIKNEYPVKPYRKILHPFNFHSWIPFYVDYDKWI